MTLAHAPIQRRDHPVAIPPAPSPPATLGIIAGQGRLPVMVAKGMRKLGHRVVAVSLNGDSDEELARHCDAYKRVPLTRLGAWVRSLRRMGATHAAMVGRVDKTGRMHDPFRLIRNVPDLKSALVWYKRLRHDKRSPAVLAAIADSLAEDGIHLIDTTAHIPDHMAEVGVMTSGAPTPGDRADIELGWPVLRSVLRLDIGQAIAVRERDVIAVEAAEGTDRMIERAGALCRGRRWALLKGARASHDRRADVPTIGQETIRNMHAAGARCVALAAGDVIIIDKPETLALADSLGVAIVGVGPDGALP